jgi:hypothetical protein
MEERESRAIARLLHEARLPRMKTLEAFEFDRSDADLPESGRGPAQVGHSRGWANIRQHKWANIHCHRQHRLHGFLEFFGWAESDPFAGGNLDGLASRRIPVALLEMSGGNRHQVTQHAFGLLLRQIMALRQNGCDLLECDGDLWRGLDWSRPLCGRGDYLRWRQD